MNVFQARTADEVWRQVHQALIAKAANTTPQPSRGGETHELLHVALEIEDPRERWITSRRPAVNPAFGIADVIWLLAGSNDAAVLNYWFPGLPRFAGEGSTYTGAYGYRLRQQFGVDQVRRACDVLASNPASRQVVLQLWDVRSDLPLDNGGPRFADVPCNIASLLKVREDRLEWTQIMRSNDLHRGLPYNILQFTVLQEIMAGWLGVGIGSYHHWSDSLHVYVDSTAEFSCDPEFKRATNTDSLAIDINRGEALVSELYRRMVALTLPDVSESRLAELISIPDVPTGYENLLRILGAESARRRARYAQAKTVMADCTNPQLVQVWSAWWERTRNVSVNPKARGARSSYSLV
jgi:thymidylate synthase